MFLNIRFHITVVLFLSVLFTCQGFASDRAEFAGCSPADQPRSVPLLSKNDAMDLVNQVVRTQNFARIFEHIPQPSPQTLKEHPHRNLRMLLNACKEHNGYGNNTVLAMLAQSGFVDAACKLKQHFTETATSDEATVGQLKEWFLALHLIRFVSVRRVYNAATDLQKKARGLQGSVEEGDVLPGYLVRTAALFDAVLTLCEHRKHNPAPYQILGVAKANYDAARILPDNDNCKLLYLHRAAELVRKFYLIFKSEPNPKATLEKYCLSQHVQTINDIEKEVTRIEDLIADSDSDKVDKIKRIRRIGILVRGLNQWLASNQDDSDASLIEPLPSPVLDLTA